MLAAVGAGLFENKSAAAQMSPLEKSFEPPEGGGDERQDARAGWKSSVARTRSHIE